MVSREMRRRLLQVSTGLAVALVGLAGLGTGLALAQASEADRPNPPAYLDGWDGTLEGLPDTIPVAGANGPAGSVTREQLIDSLGDHPVDLAQLSDGATIQPDVVGPTQDGTLGPIGTQTCTVHHDDSGASLACDQEVLDDRARPFPVTPTTS